MGAADQAGWAAAMVGPVFGRPSPTAERPWRLAQDPDGPPRTSATAGIRADAADTSWCGLRAATVVGIRHRLTGSAGQDAWAWGADDGAVVLAVADGLGSFESSGAVAAAVVEVALRAVLGGADMAPGDRLAAAVVAANEAVAPAAVDGGASAAATGSAPARSVGFPWSAGSMRSPEVAADTQTAEQHAVEGEAVPIGAVPSEPGAACPPGASTLVLALIDRDGNAELVRVGDSTAFLLAGGVWTELFVDAERAREDDVRTPVTAALPAAVPDLQVARTVLVPGDALVLVTDGVGDPLRDGPTTVAPGLAEALAVPPSPLALATLVDFSRQGCQDDRTLVGLWLEGSKVSKG